MKDTLQGPHSQCVDLNALNLKYVDTNMFKCKLHIKLLLLNLLE